MTVDSIIFDLDGTLWDATREVTHAWQTAAAAFGGVPQPTLADMQSAMGLEIAEIGERLFPALEPARREALLAACCQEECRYLAQHGGRLYEGVKETLGALAERYPLFIVSNCPDGYIQAFLGAHGLDGVIADFECPGRTGKPKSENIRLIVKRNSLARPVYVGDTQKDADSARAAGVPFVFASYGFGEVEEYDERIEQLSELLTLV